VAHEQVVKVGIVGARGYVGTELIGLIKQHPHLQLSYAASRSQVGQVVPGMEDTQMELIDASPQVVASQDADVVILAVPDGATEPYVEVLGDAIVLDLSSDHRFDDAWVYGLSEHNAESIANARRISNPGCYATAVQLALGPIIGLVEGTPHSFGVSGYSGAGTTPSARNDPKILGDGITPYALIGHTHEREISRHLGRSVRFSPHVAPFFRGITVTVQSRVREPMELGTLIEMYACTYEGSGLIEVLGERVPRVQEIAGRCGAQIGGLTIGNDGHDIAGVCTIDNLLKGAASQAIQNLNLAFGFDAELGLVDVEVMA
jgi:N-acetyl-gamma-glutamyl-phosphate reductase